MREDTNCPHPLSTIADVDIKNYYLQVWMQIAVLEYADANNSFIRIRIFFNLIYIFLYFYIYSTYGCLIFIYLRQLSLSLEMSSGLEFNYQQ
jgi:hypothetical protein